MAAGSGRDFVVKKNGTALAGLRENSLTPEGGSVDLTSKEDNGFRKLADFHGTRSWDMSASGVLKDAVFQDIIMDPSASLLLTDVTLEFHDGAIVAGDVYIGSATFAGAHDGEATYELSLQSSGQWTYTAAP